MSFTEPKQTGKIMLTTGLITKLSLCAYEIMSQLDGDTYPRMAEELRKEIDKSDNGGETIKRFAKLLQRSLSLDMDAE